MGEIVAAMGTCHAPQLFTRPPTEDPKQLDATVAAMRELGRTLDETKPDLLLVIGSDHLETFFLSAVPTFALIAGERATAAFAGRNYTIPIHQPFAEDLLERLVSHDFDMVYSQDAVLGHAFAGAFRVGAGRPPHPRCPSLRQYLPAASAQSPPLRSLGPIDRRSHPVAA
jgi:2,3-dihydroxyphenylpropionate 1,2-dioxygenase